MKYFILTALFVPLLFLSSAIQAQMDEPNLPAVGEVSDMGDDKKEEEETIFSKASDAQLKEANNFYKICTKNESMSSLKNCKCAAGEYLEKRVELGDAASASDIMSAISGECFIDVENNKSSDSSDSIDLSEITDAQIEEADAILQKCQATLKLRRFYDCECYAAKFLDGRIKKGPLVSKEEIIETFYNDCRNIIESTGYEYTRCMARTVKRPVNNIEPKDFCECYARQWGKLFEAYDGIINFSSKNLMKLQARAYCKRSNNYNFNH